MFKYIYLCFCLKTISIAGGVIFQLEKHQVYRLQASRYNGQQLLLSSNKEDVP